MRLGGLFIRSGAARDSSKFKRRDRVIRNSFIASHSCCETVTFSTPVHPSNCHTIVVLSTWQGR